MKGGQEGKRKEKLKTAVSLLNPKLSQNFAFRACPNFAHLYITSGSEGHDVYDL